MFVRLHSQRTTTPKTRVAIQANDRPTYSLAERHGNAEQTFGNGANTTVSRIAATLPNTFRLSVVRVFGTKVGLN